MAPSDAEGPRTVHQDADVSWGWSSSVSFSRQPISDTRRQVSEDRRYVNGRLPCQLRHTGNRFVSFWLTFFIVEQSFHSKLPLVQDKWLFSGYWCPPKTFNDNSIVVIQMMLEVSVWKGQVLSDFLWICRKSLKIISRRMWKFGAKPPDPTNERRLRLLQQFFKVYLWHVY